MKRFSRTINVALALFVGVFSSGLIQLYAAPNAAAAGDKPVYCNIQGASGTWKAQMSAGNTEHEYVLLDSNGNPVMVENQSQVGQFDGACLKQTAPKLTVTPGICTTGAALPGQTSFTIMNPAPHTTTYTWSLSGTSLSAQVTLSQNQTSSPIYVSLAPGTYTLTVSGNDGTTANNQFTVNACPVVVTQIALPATPAVTDPCNPASISYNASWVVPANDAQFSWSLNQATGHLVVTILTPNTVFVTNGLTTYDFGVAPDSGVACTAANPTIALIESTCDYQKSGETTGSVTFTITNAKDETNASATYTWSITQNGAVVAASPAAIALADGGSSNPIVVNTLEDGTYTITISGSDQTAATIEAGVTACPAEGVNPTTPTAIDYCYNDIDEVIVPTTTGVHYWYNESDVSGQFIRYRGTPIVITATAADGYALSADAAAMWIFDDTVFTNKQCVSITKTGVVPADTNGNGVIGTGDIVTWHITVTNNGTVAIDTFDLQIDDLTAATLENDGVINNLLPGESRTVTATTVLTDEDTKACKASNTATFSVLNLATDYIPLGSAIGEVTFTCPTPGHGGGHVNGDSTVVTTAVTTTAAELPAELPATGPVTTGSPLLVVLASVLAYGATFFVQNRRDILKA